LLNNGRDTLAVTVSIGIAATDSKITDDSAQKLVKRADEALYAAKSSGRNRVIASAA
jgi:two-component system cell cycle response regulator